MKIKILHKNEQKSFWLRPDAADDAAAATATDALLLLRWASCPRRVRVWASKSWSSYTRKLLLLLVDGSGANVS